MAKHTSFEGITRRDFLNGVLLVSGAAGVRSFFPARLFAQACDFDGWASARSGDMEPAFRIAHLLRDQRLSIEGDTVTIAPSLRDTLYGTYPIVDDGETFDVVIVGAGLSGLATAFFITREHPAARILLLDAHDSPGGTAAQDDGVPPLPVIAAAGGVYFTMPDDSFLPDFYESIGIDWSRSVESPSHSCYFDGNTPYIQAGARGWTSDTFGTGAKNIPYPQAIVADFIQSIQHFRQWRIRHGAPTDPADSSDPRFDYLAHMTLDAYLSERGFHPAIADLYSRYTVDALGGPAAHVNAYTSIAGVGGIVEAAPALPGGAAAVARRLAAMLFETPDSGVHFRQAVGVRVEDGASGGSAIYWKDGAFRRVRGGAIVVATQSYSAKHLAGHLMSAGGAAAWDEFTMSPMVVANVALRSAAPILDLGLGYSLHWWGSRRWAGGIVADWCDLTRRAVRDRETVLTISSGNTLAPDQMAAQRTALFTTPFCDYEDSLREDLNRVLADGGFDYDRDVTAMYLYRWGHAKIYPTLGFPFGPPESKEGRTIRTPAPRHLARQQTGHVSFAGQDAEGSSSVESAIASGSRAAQEILSTL